MWRYDQTTCTLRAKVDDKTKTHGSVERRGQLPVDITCALSALVHGIRSGDEQLALWFSQKKPLIAARAPGRLDVMGGIADYSGSTVLQLPIEESTVVFAQANHTPELRIISQASDQDTVSRIFCMPIRDFFDTGSGMPCSENSMRLYFSGLAAEHRWAAYVAGVLTVLMQHFKQDLTHGAGIVLYISSTVPMGKGVSSSAALEVAVMRALCGVLDLDLSAHQQALLCQRVENHVVGAPCGLMDQMASSCGEQGALLNMLCQPDTLNNPVTLPEGMSLWGVDSGIRHAVSGADYSSVRVAAFMGYRYMLEEAGIANRRMAAADIRDTRWHGYLANVSVAEYLHRFEAVLPERLSGREFLQRYDDTTDNVTSIDPEVDYAVRACTAHPVHEHFRARLFIQLATSALQLPDHKPLRTLMGECMYQSHASYSNCGLDSSGTDDLVARFHASGHTSGIYGARITGGGSGGVVAVLARTDADPLIRSIAADYAAASGLGGYVFSGSSAGAGVYSLVPATAS